MVSNIRKMQLSQLNPAPYNPRVDLQPGDAAYDQLAASIAEFGNVQPIVWNERTGNIVGGHQKYKILKAQGVQEDDVVVVNLSLEKEKVLNLALNNIHGENDDEKLRELLDQMAAEDIELSGIDMELYFGDVEEEEEAESKDRPEIAFTEELHEENNYIVLFFDNDIDWLNAQSIFGLKTVKSLDSNAKKCLSGVGRVIRGQDAMRRIREAIQRSGSVPAPEQEGDTEA